MGLLDRNSEPDVFDEADAAHSQYRDVVQEHQATASALADARNRDAREKERRERKAAAAEREARAPELTPDFDPSAAATALEEAQGPSTETQRLEEEKERLEREREEARERLYEVSGRAIPKRLETTDEGAEEIRERLAEIGHAVAERLLPVLELFEERQEQLTHLHQLLNMRRNSAPEPGLATRQASEVRRYVKRQAEDATPAELLGHVILLEAQKYREAVEEGRLDESTGERIGLGTRI